VVEVMQMVFHPDKTLVDLLAFGALVRRLGFMQTAQKAIDIELPRHGEQVADANHYILQI